MANREYTQSSGKVFADLHLADADELLTKAGLAAKIVTEVQRRRITQTQAAAILGIDQPKVSALTQGELSDFSIERLMRFLLLLGRDVEITVKAKPRSRSVARLRVAKGVRRISGRHLRIPLKAISDSGGKPIRRRAKRRWLFDVAKTDRNGQAESVRSEAEVGCR